VEENVPSKEEDKKEEQQEEEVSYISLFVSSS
jgi:hypothetical protein